ncbi:diacylglycerol acyltransferase [Cantharellus anzutake]|uniref:diacylglycerol acyltransferase n=1 Tax=Cantharellus anzutake TaxID=1750568 RepID=UPI00190462F8|nr:diacylglycerol acyltransferase [Cantharellus anzutake]KAF8324328.1 diacylglycerol acyltransferase [Cantharellus anzutake]
MPPDGVSDARGKSTIQAVDFFHVPLQRRLQTMAVAFWGFQMVISVSVFLYLCSFPSLWPLTIIYTIWVFGFDTSPRRGGRASKWFRNLPFWKLWAAYYPQTLIRTEELPPDRPYVFGYHPHGIIGMGAFCTFGTNATGFEENFPGIQPHLLTLTNNFHIPIYRDILLHLGVCSVSKASCTNILKRGAGQSITIVIGGAAESLSAHPGTADLTLRKRLGFIKIAIQNGADLVPVFAFGENDVFEQLKNEKGSTIYSIQTKFQKLFGFTLPLFHGRGLFTYNVGLLPFRHPIVSVVGRPVSVKQNPNPSKQEVEEVQKRYIEELYWIWETYKNEYAKDRTREMVLIA